MSHFKKFGSVVEAKLARDFKGTLLDYTAEAKYTTKYNFEKRKVIQFNFNKDWIINLLKKFLKCQLKPDRPKKILKSLEKKIKSIEKKAQAKAKRNSNSVLRVKI